MVKRKLIFATLVLLAAASGCKVEETEPAPEMAPGAGKMYPVHFVADEIETRTVFGEAETVDGATSYPTLWTANDSQIAVALNLKEFRPATVQPAEDFKSATFDAEFPQSEVVAPYVFYALSPFSAAAGATASHGGFHLNILAEQTPLASSCDEGAQVMAASQEVASVENFRNVDLHFSHVTAYGKLKLTNMSLPEGVSILSIDLTASAPLAGEYFYGFAEETLEASASSRTVTIKPDHLTLVDAGTETSARNIEAVWFACAPADLGGGFFKVDVNTSAGILSRTVEIPEGRLEFKSGRISKFTVNMQSAEFTQTADRWVLVTDASVLQAGDEIIIANSAQAGSAFAMSTTQYTNNRGKTAVSIAQDTDGQMIIQNPGTDVEILTLVSGAYSGYFYLKETTSTAGRYLGTTKSTSQNYLESNAVSTATNSTNKGYYNWMFSIVDKVAYITAYQTVGVLTTSYKHLRYNSTATSFSAYKSSSRTSWDGTGSENVYIYRKGTGLNVDSDPILEQETYGAYLSGSSLLFGAGCQMSREYAADGTLTFAILKPSEYMVAEFNGIPADPAKGDTFTLSYCLISGRDRSDTDYNVTVVKVDGPKVWLSVGDGQGFIVKK